MAVTAHWIEAVEEKTSSGSKKKLQLRSDLIGFHKLPGCHTDEHLAHCFLYITDCLNITGKVLISSGATLSSSVCRNNWITSLGTGSSSI